MPTPHAPGWVAYVDESQRSEGAGAYILAAVVLDGQTAESIRPQVAALAAGKQRFHWRLESPSRQRKAVAVVAGLPALHIVVVAVGVKARQSERARRYCLDRLLYELDHAGVSQVWLEARGPHQNRLDSEVVNVFRVRGNISDTIRIDHGYPDQEVLLWLGDIVAGALSASVAGDPSYMSPLEA
ncbi:MAG: hypothetical protein ACRDPW_09870, partial [Mycobacteriales bacterium]